MGEDVEDSDAANIQEELWEARKRQDAGFINEAGDIMHGEPTGWIDGLLEDAHKVIESLRASLTRVEEERGETVKSLARALDEMACGGDVTRDHYCPNCGNDTTKARVIIDVLHSRLSRAEVETGNE